MRLMWLLLICFFCTQSASADVRADLIKALEKARIRDHVVGMQMTITLPDGHPMNFVAGLTQLDGGEHVSPETLFQIGSNTKSFTSALVLKLVSEGRLKLTDTVGQFFPEYPQWQDAKLFQLLTNTSGIYNYSQDRDFQRKVDTDPTYPWTNDEMLVIAGNHPIDFLPGQGWHYSNTNFVLAGMMAEKVTEESLGDLFSEYFLGKSPLRLRDTYYLPNVYPPFILNRLAHGYDAENKDVSYTNMAWAGAAGAMVSTSGDLARWVYSLFHGRILNDKMLAEMFQLHSVKTGALLTAQDKEGYGMGLGMRINPKYGKWYGHEGETQGYHSIFVWYPDMNLTIVVLTNGLTPHLREFATNIPQYFPELLKQNKDAVIPEGL